MTTPKKSASRKTEAQDAVFHPGLGLDVGTANIASGRSLTTSEGQTICRTRTVRDCFLNFPAEDVGTLEMADVPYAETNSGQLVVVGKEALRIAAALGLEVRRPLAQGFISDKEELSKDVVKILLEDVLGEPTEEGELVAFSVPGAPYQGDPAKATFHTRFFSDRIRELGFKPLPINEAMAIGYNALDEIAATDPSAKDRKLTGLCISFGAGMTNVALVYQGLCAKAFSLPLGGDYIDQTVSKNTNTPIASVTLLKEEGVDLFAADTAGRDGVPAFIPDRKPHHDATSDRQAEAITMVYRDLLEALKDAMNGYFNDPKNRVDIRETIPVVVAGGTTLATGFLPLFDQIVLSGLDIRIPLMKHAVTTASPLTSVAQGAARFAQSRMLKARAVE